MGHLRPDLVEEQGLDPTRFQGEWTWDLLEELGEAFAGTDLNAFAYYAGTSTYLAYSFRELLFQQGGRMVQDDGTVVMNSPEAVRVVQKMKDWRDAGYVPSDVISYGEGDIVDLLAAGQVAYTTAFSDFIPRLLQEYEAGTEYQVVTPPAANAGPAPAQAGLVAPNPTSINTFSDTSHKLAALLYGDLKLSYFTQWFEFTYEGNISYMNQVYDDGGEHVVAVDDVNLEVYDGEFIVVAGASGCGKTTTLRIVARLERPTEGRIVIRGEDVSGQDPRERDVAMVFQNYALYPHKTVRKNIAFPLEIRKYDREEIEERSPGRRRCSASANCSTGVRRTSRADSNSGSRLGGPSSATPSCSCSTSRSPIWTRSSASRCGPNSTSSTTASGRPRSTSPTTRPRR
jgi:hypothetical protein